MSFAAVIFQFVSLKGTLGFGGDTGFGCQTPPALAQTFAPKPRRCSPHQLFIYCSTFFLLNPPPYFFSLFQGPCKTSWDFARRPQQRLFSPLCSGAGRVLPSAPVPLGKGRTFPPLQPLPATGSGQHRTNQPERLFPTVFILKIKSYHCLQPPLGCRVRGDRSALSMGIFHLHGISPCIRIPRGRGRRGTCLCKHLRTDQTLWSRPSPALSVCGRGKAECSTHGAGTAKESQENRVGGSSSHRSPTAGGISPLSWGRFLTERQRFPPGATSASEIGSEKAAFEHREAGRAAGCGAGRERAGSAHILGKLARLAMPQALFMLRARRT